jgi:hypothetical protein
MEFSELGSGILDNYMTIDLICEDTVRAVRLTGEGLGYALGWEQASKRRKLCDFVNTVTILEWL